MFAPAAASDAQQPLPVVPRRALFPVELGSPGTCYSPMSSVAAVALHRGSSRFIAPVSIRSHTFLQGVEERMLLEQRAGRPLRPRQSAPAKQTSPLFRVDGDLVAG